MKKRMKTVLFWLPAIIWLAAVFLLSRQNATDSAGLSQSVTAFLLRICPWIDMPAAALEPVLRKIAHAAMFAIEGFLLYSAAAWSFGRKAGFALSAGICALLAVTSELVQTIADGRSCELRDMAIDLGGALIGMLAALAFMLFIDKLSHRRVTKRS